MQTQTHTQRESIYIQMTTGNISHIFKHPLSEALSLSLCWLLHINSISTIFWLASSVKLKQCYYIQNEKTHPIATPHSKWECERMWNISNCWHIHTGQCHWSEFYQLHVNYIYILIPSRFWVHCFTIQLIQTNHTFTNYNVQLLGISLWWIMCKLHWNICVLITIVYASCSSNVSNYSKIFVIVLKVNNIIYWKTLCIFVYIFAGWPTRESRI